MYHVNDNISDAYYDTNTSRVDVNISENLNSYPIGSQIECQEVILSPSEMANPYGYGDFAYDNYYDSDLASGSNLVLPLITRQQNDYDSSNNESSIVTASIADSTTCSWDMLGNNLE